MAKEIVESDANIHDIKNQINDIYNKGKIKYPGLFEEFKIGNVTVPNRLFWPPWCFNWANTDGTMSDKLYDFYIDLAEGGCGMIITGCAAVSPDNLLYHRSMKIYTKKQADSFKKLCKDLTDRGCVPAIQLMNFGRQSVTLWTGESTYGPSAVPSTVKSKQDHQYDVREMTLGDLERIKKDFVISAILAAEAGFKVIQLHAANGFLLSEFISPIANKRLDKYGGSIENRTRFVAEIVKEIREKLDDTVAIDIRLSTHEFISGGVVPSDFKRIIPILEEAGVDMINMGYTISETTGKVFRKNIKKIPEAPFIDMAQELKGYTTRDNTLVGYNIFIKSLETAEKIIKEQRADLIGIGRMLFANPQFIKESVDNSLVESNNCIWCNKCLFSFTSKSLKESYCSKNEKYLETKSTLNISKISRNKVDIEHSKPELGILFIDGWAGGFEAYVQTNTHDEEYKDKLKEDGESVFNFCDYYFYEFTEGDIVECTLSFAKPFKISGEVRFKVESINRKLNSIKVKDLTFSTLIIEGEEKEQPDNAFNDLVLQKIPFFKQKRSCSPDQ